MRLLRLWVILELNLVVFVGLIKLAGGNTRGAELKYFIIQRLASSFFILAFLLSLFRERGLTLAMVLGGLLLKIGGAPFHL